MSIQHYVHEILTPGLDGDGFTAAEAAQIRDEIENYGDAVGRIDPGAGGPVGASLSQGPNGPAWRDDAVSADWFSNPQDAVDAAGAGGRVLFSKDTTYNLSDPLLVVNGTEIIGEDRLTTILRSSGESIIRSATQDTAQIQDVVISNLTLDGNHSTPICLDARDMVRCYFDLLRVLWPAEYGVWFGGDSGKGGWSNSLWRSLVRAGQSGAAVRFYGRGLAGRTGPNNANNNTIMDCVLYNAISAEENASFAIDMDEGEGNQIINNDMGYNPGTAVRVNERGTRNTFIGNRFEDPLRCVRIDGAATNNRFISNNFHVRTTSTYSPVRINAGAQWNVFAWNYMTPNGNQAGFIPGYEDGTSPPTTTILTPAGRSFIPNWSSDFVNNYRSITSRLPGDTEPRTTLLGAGGLQFGDGSSSPDAFFQRHGTKRVGTTNDTTLQAGSGRWDEGYLRLGNYHIWVDASGKLRIKSSPPASDTDGSVVGGQS